MIFAIALLGLLFFAGLAVDAGMLYVTYGQLKRAVDAASVAAATEFKRPKDINQAMTNVQLLDKLENEATGILRLHNIDTDTVTLNIYICDLDGDGQRDASLQTSVPDFYARCPSSNQSMRKLVWIDASMQAPLYFLHLLGFESVNLRTSAISEAAPVDLVLVFDVSESMGVNTGQTPPTGIPAAPGPFVANNYDPGVLGGGGTGCNTNDSCLPLRQAKEAAKTLIKSMFSGYDQVGIVTFDSQVYLPSIKRLNTTNAFLSDDMNEVSTAINSVVQLHDDPPASRIWYNWQYTPGSSPGVGEGEFFYNPVNPEDRDADGNDGDPALPLCSASPGNPLCCNLDADRWDSTKDPLAWGYGGMPCDADNAYDAYHWTVTTDVNGFPQWGTDPGYTVADHNATVTYLNKYQNHYVASVAAAASGTTIQASLSPLSTCTGCGLRLATEVLKEYGRPGAVWVMVVLSDGMVNLSDMPATNTKIDAMYKNGFCQGKLTNNPAQRGFWPDVCIDYAPSPRYCVDTNSDTCPPGSVYAAKTPLPYYSVLDYARDMADDASLSIIPTSVPPAAANKEPKGADIAVYTIGLGNIQNGEGLLRYIAAVGDDGDRRTDPCSTVGAGRSCGQYYYAKTAADLQPIFESIASRIFTRLTR